MKSIPILGIPHYNRPDLTARCIASIDYPVDKLVLVMNGNCGTDGTTIIGEALGCLRANTGAKCDVIILNHPNAGVAGAWNEIIKLFPAPYWLIANNDIQFAPGDLQRMHEGTLFHMSAWECPMCQSKFLPGQVNEVGHGLSCLHCDPTGEKKGGRSIEIIEVKPGKLYGNHGASFFTITEYGVAKVGLFDENIFPAYLEDCDWSYRADLLGVRRLNIPGIVSVHGDDTLKGSCTVNSDPQIALENSRTHNGNFDYYIAKWGGRNEHETFKIPFNNPNWPVWAWRFDPKFRKRQQWGSVTLHP